MWNQFVFEKSFTSTENFSPHHLPRQINQWEALEQKWWKMGQTGPHTCKIPFQFIGLRSLSIFLPIPKYIHDAENESALRQSVTFRVINKTTVPIGALTAPLRHITAEIWTNKAGGVVWIPW